MVNKPLTRPYFLGGVALGGVARIPLTEGFLGETSSPHQKKDGKCCMKVS